MKIMKRTIMSKSAATVVSYEPVPTTEDEPPDNKKVKKSGVLCASSRRRMYVLMILTGVVLLWVFIYYKLLNHRFELPEPLRGLRKMFGDGDAKHRGRWEVETENIDFETGRKTCLPHFENERNSELIHIAIVACKGRVKEALVNLKAITLITNHNIYFHIFTEVKYYDDFREELESWPSWKQHWMMYTPLSIHYPGDITYKEWSEMFKPCASQRLFLASILTYVDSVIYVDTDVLFLQPPEVLWKQFKKFNTSQIAGLAYECEHSECWYNMHATHPFYEPYGVNSGVMLMNLTRMRMLGWEEELVEIYEQYKLEITYGDQDILNIFFQAHRDLLYIFSCGWNYRPDHCMKENNCREAVYDGISALHGNRQVFQKSKLQPEFFTVYEAYRKYDFEKDDFQEKIVNATRDKLSSKKYRTTPCGKMKDAILQHLECPGY